MLNRRGFLRGLLVAVAAVAIEVKLHTSKPIVTIDKANFVWQSANDRYAYAINTSNPLEVIIQDRGVALDRAYITPDELMRRSIENIDMYSSPEAVAAYEATAIVAISQGKLLFDRGVTRMAMVPAFVSTLDDSWDDYERSDVFENDQPYILTEPEQLTA